MPEPVVYEEVSESRVQPYVNIARREIVGVLITGALVGVAVFVLYTLLNKFVFGAVLCRAQSTGDCSAAPNYAMIVALIIATIGGVASLARLRVYRPLLIGIAVAISLWGLQTVLAGVAWYWSLLDMTVLFALAYLAMMWIARVRNLILAVVVMVVVVILVRWFLVA